MFQDCIAAEPLNNQYVFHYHSISFWFVHSTVILLIDMSSNGLSFLSVFASSMASTLSRPPTARPNTLKLCVLGYANKGAGLQTHVCLPSNHWQGTVVMKNCDPLVPGPAVKALSLRRKSSNSQHTCISHWKGVRSIMPKLGGDFVLKSTTPNALATGTVLQITSVQIPWQILEEPLTPKGSPPWII